MGRPRPLNPLRLRPGDVRSLEIRKTEEFEFRCELRWRKPGGERGEVHMIGGYPEVHELLTWLRGLGLPRDIDDQLWNHPVSEQPIVDISVDDG